MLFTTFYRLAKTGFVNFLRNGWLSLASTIIMTLTLITISVFLILNIVLTQGIQTIQDKIDISVYLKDSATSQTIFNMQKDLSNNPDVKQVNYITKDQAKQRYDTTFANNPQLKDSLDQSGNPLPASLEIKTYDPSKLASLMPMFDRPPYKDAVSKVSYQDNKQVIDRLFKATEFIKKVGWGLAIAFILTSLIIIFNTIRTAIYTHKSEIEIMKLVGANPWFIKWPFLIEGILYGVFGTALSLLVIYILLRLLSVSFNAYFGGGSTGDQVFGFLMQNLGPLLFLQLAAGITIGVVSSSVAIRKYLKKS